ncbi:UNVERIFIED_CONTAM: Mitogen-activated protein kinase kinase kinase YODA [Sesamum radiatum]|uniref:Mitogen-activated protein kinase kinase kinase YODA n=1 Tax=Sesamum radiatum TaxID=300843 RepID=A0AAW2JY31_SESRA
MSMIYDNWERLVAAVLKKEQLWQLFHDQSRSPSISSESSVSVSVGVLQLKMRHFQAQNGQLLNRREKIILVLQVPKLQLESHVECNRAQDNSEYCRNISPRMASPTSSSRLHPRAGGGHNKPQTNWPEDAKQKGHPLPLPPVAISRPSPVSRPNSAATSPTLPTHSPERAGNPRSPSTRWKKGKLLGRGAVGDIYLGFDSEKGEMCAMKEVKLSSDDAMSKQRAMVLEIELSVLSQLRHPNIVQYYGAEKIIGQSHPSLLRESPYWMAPEVIMNPTVRDPAIDIWSLGCTVLEIAKTTYEPVQTVESQASCYSRSAFGAPFVKSSSPSGKKNYIFSSSCSAKELAAASDQELLGGAANGQLYGQSMLADRVSHQLSFLKLNPSRHLYPSSPSLSHHIAGV